MSRIKRFLPITLILILMGVAYALGFFHIFSLDKIKQFDAFLKNYVEIHPFLSPLAFMGLYILMAALSIPDAFIMSILGGFLFFQPWSTAYVLIGATIGATLIFLATKTAFGDLLFKRKFAFIKKLDDGFKKNETSYLLFLRLVPLCPFVLVNLAAGFFKVRTSSFIWTTFVGSLPSAFLLTQVGRGLTNIFKEEENFSIKTIFSFQVTLALVCLAFLGLLPILYKKWKDKKEKSDPD